MKYLSQNIFIFSPEIKIFLNAINLQTYIVEHKNYTELQRFRDCQRHNPHYGIRRYCVTMKYRIKDTLV